MFITDEQKREIEQVGKKYDLKLILVYGSYAKGNNKDKSDLDLAILGKKSIGFEELLSIHRDIARVFGDKRERELDITTLHRVDPLFCYQVAKNNVLLFGNLADYNEFRAYAFSCYFDSKDLFNLEKRLTEKFQLYLNEKYAG